MVALVSKRFSFLFPSQNQVKWVKLIWNSSIPPSRFPNLETDLKQVAN